jgi:hypothetical protein
MRVSSWSTTQIAHYLKKGYCESCLNTMRFCYLSIKIQQIGRSHARMDSVEMSAQPGSWETGLLDGFLGK